VFPAVGDEDAELDAGALAEVVGLGLAFGAGLGGVGDEEDAHGGDI
jgi:hypothetical protein